MAQRPNDSENLNKTSEASKPAAASVNSAPQAVSSNTMPSYLEAALRIPSSLPTGAPTADDNILGLNHPTSPIPIGKAPIPGIMVFGYLPTLGVSSTTVSALNRAVYEQFNMIRAKISGNRPYEPSDHMIYRIAVSSLRELYITLERIYAIARSYSATNVYKPKAILSAMGLDADNVIASLSYLYQWLVSHQSALTPFPTVPVGDMEAVHAVWNSRIFTDGDIDQSQMYIFVQRGYYSYEVVDQVKGLTVRKLPARVDQIIEMWEDMYSALMTSSDVYVIAADIRRAFEDKVVTALPSITVDAQIEYAKYDPILTSIMNACIVQCDIELDGTAFRIVDEPGMGLRCTPTLTKEIYPGRETYPISSNVMLNHINMVEAAPNAAAVLDAVRLKPVLNIEYTVSDTGIIESQITHITSMGTEIVVDCSFYVYNSDMELVPTNVHGCTMLCYSEREGYIYMYPDHYIANAKIANFDWHPPLVTMFYQNGEASRCTGYSIYEDVQNYIPISNTQLTSIHEANILARFGF